MATISNVRLSIQKGGGGSRRSVSVRYNVCYSACEILAGSTFHSVVTLRGDDPLWDDYLITLFSGCIKAAEGCPQYAVDASVSRSTLDEDGDTIIEIFGWKIAQFADQDEIYAHVELTPFQPTGGSANSNIVTGQWGDAGGD